MTTPTWTRIEMIDFVPVLSRATEQDSPPIPFPTTSPNAHSIRAIDEASGKGTPPPSAPTGPVPFNAASPSSPSTFATRATNPSSSDATTGSPTSASVSLPGTERTPSPLGRKLAVGLAVPATILLLLACILLGMYLRRRHESRNTAPASPGSSRSPQHDDYNAEPLDPHKPLARRSDSPFATHAGPSHGSSIPPPGDSPHLPELETLTAADSPHSDRSSDDFGTYFSGLDDPFTDAAASVASHQMTPGVSPSTYPLRDRLVHESERRRRAVEGFQRGRSRERDGGKRERRVSISERELGELVGAFEGVDGQRVEERKLRVRSEEDVGRGGGRESGFMRGGRR